MLLAILLTLYGIMFILALLHLAANSYAKRDRQRRPAARGKYKDRIRGYLPVDSMVEAAVPASDLQRQEAKRKMVADIRTYFNERKLDEAIREAEIKTGLPMNSPMFSSGPDTTHLPTPPSLQRILE